MKINTIIPGELYQSKNMLSVQNRIELLQQYGITIVVNCWRDDPVLAAQKTIRYVHCPIPDGKEVPKALFALAEGLAYAIRQEDAQVLTMCHAGRNRSGLLSALIVRSLLGCNGRYALLVVREGRPRSCGSNPNFEEYLLKLPAPGVAHGLA